MTSTQQIAPIDATDDRTRDMTIHVAGRGLFLVMRNNREIFRGTFEQCYDCVSSGGRGLTC
jgi:hypothetical protein